MSRKTKIIISVTGIVLVLVTLIGLTYAYYLTRINGNINDKSVTVSLANLELTYDDGNGFIEAKNVIPGEVIATKTFSVENTGDKKVINYTVYLDDVINTFENKNDVKLTLTCTSSKGNKCTGTEITYPSTDTLLSINDIEVEEKHNYELKVEFIETNTDQSIDMNKELSGNIIIRDLKGTGSEITNTKGTNSVSVENAKLLSNYRIYGNSVQETRSGKNLVKKLVSGGNIVLTNDIITTGSASVDTYFFLRNEDFANLNGKEATLSFDAEVSSDTAWKFAVNQSSPTTEFYVKNGHNVVTFTINNATDGITIDDIVRDPSIKCTIKNLQIELGSTATDYEAYGATPSPDIPSEIKSVGDLVTDTSDTNYGKYKLEINTLSIPKEYQEVEYIESTGTQYIDTNVIPTSKTKINLKFMPPVSPSSTYQYDALLGVRKYNYNNGGKQENSFGIWINSSSHKLALNYNSIDTSQIGESVNLNKINNFYNENNQFYLNNKLLYESTNQDEFEAENSMILFGIKENTVPTRFISNLRIYSLKIKEENKLLRNFIPCYRKSDNAIGLYDTVENKFYPNNGTGSFLKGENIEHNTYNIYLDEPLRKIDNYSDYIDFKSGKVIRNIKELKFDGTEDWKNYTATNVNQMYLENSISSTSSSCLSNIAPYGVLANSRQNYKYGCYAVTSGTGIAFQLYGWNSSLTVSQWKTWLNTNNVMADYILKETLEESISLPNIDLNKVKYINIESDTNPSSVELDYIK